MATKEKVSSLIKDFYVSKEHGLVIELNSGEKYSYPDATVELFEAFKEAESKGKFFAQNIRQLKSVKL